VQQNTPLSGSWAEREAVIEWQRRENRIISRNGDGNSYFQGSVMLTCVEKVIAAGVILSVAATPTASWDSKIVHESVGVYCWGSGCQNGNAG
jgi:hypothetical protein